METWKLKLMIKYQFQQYQFCFKLISLSPYLAHLTMSTLENVLFAPHLSPYTPSPSAVCGSRGKRTGGWRCEWSIDFDLNLNLLFDEWKVLINYFFFHFKSNEEFLCTGDIIYDHD